MIARVVQGVGEAATTVCTAVARDVLIDVDERTRAMAILGSLRPLAIVAAPSVGGLVGAFFGWRYVFRGLAVWGAALFGAVAELNGAFKDALCAAWWSGRVPEHLSGISGEFRVGTDEWLVAAQALFLGVFFLLPETRPSTTSSRPLDGFGVVRRRLAAGCRRSGGRRPRA